MGNLTKNFDIDEFRCPCCGKVIDNIEFRRFVVFLQTARSYASFPFVITSGYRCPKHNAEVGGVPDSAHTKGLAVDIRVRSTTESAAAGNHRRFAIVDALREANFKRIGVHELYIHVDMDADKPQYTMWVY